MFLFVSLIRNRSKEKAEKMPAVGGIAPGNGRKEYPGNLTAYVTVTCIVAAMGGLIFGYDIGISGKYLLLYIHQSFILYMYVHGLVLQFLFFVFKF